MDRLIKLANDSEIKELISKTKPISVSNLGLTKIEADLSYGFYDFYFKNENQEDSRIHLTTYESDIIEVLEFLWSLTKTECPICTLIEDEGENGIFYAEPINNTQVHFVVADDYELYKRFCRYDEDYSFADAHICLDIIINKNRLIKQFYDAIWKETKNYRDAKLCHFWDGIEKQHLDLFNKLKNYIDKSNN